MRIKRHAPEQIIFKLREAEVALAQGKRIRVSASNWASLNRLTTGGGGSLAA